MTRLSEDRLAVMDTDIDDAMCWDLQDAGYVLAMDEVVELIRGYRAGLVALALLGEWAADEQRGWVWRCGYCRETLPDHYEECMVRRAEALLAEMGAQG